MEIYKSLYRDRFDKNRFAPFLKQLDNNRSGTCLAGSVGPWLGRWPVSFFSFSIYLFPSYLLHTNSK